MLGVMLLLMGGAYLRKKDMGFENTLAETIGSESRLQVQMDRRSQECVLTYKAASDLRLVSIEGFSVNGVRIAGKFPFVKNDLKKGDQWQVKLPFRESTLGAGPYTWNAERVVLWPNGTKIEATGTGPVLVSN